VQQLAPDALVLAVADAARLPRVAELADRLRHLPTAIWVGGAGAGHVDGAGVLQGSPLEAAEQVAG
jgi:hypothetical protein